MIIKTDFVGSPGYHRLIEVPSHSPYSTALRDICRQWGIPDDSGQVLLWSDKGRLEAQEGDSLLIIDSQEEWLLFCRIYCKDPSQIVHLSLIERQALPSQSQSQTQEPIDRQQKQVVQRSASPVRQVVQQRNLDPPAAARPTAFAFHSVEPQLTKAQKEVLRAEQEGRSNSTAVMDDQQAGMPSSGNGANSGMDGEGSSAYDRMMARSRLQGEGLNQLFGSMMAKRAGGSNLEAQEPLPSSSTPLVEMPSSSSSSSSTTSRVLQDRVRESNTRLETAWEARLQEMGHRARPATKGKEVMDEHLSDEE